MLARDERRARCMAFAYLVSGMYISNVDAPHGRLHPMFYAYKKDTSDFVQTQLRRELLEYLNDFVRPHTLCLLGYVTNIRPAHSAGQHHGRSHGVRPYGRHPPCPRPHHP